uniref:guided entry of tail-anchored proteins factor CAMLG n=1 Tax=Myxine glutinosa TaxID=7769 RepID=UPI00358E8D44
MAATEGGNPVNGDSSAAPDGCAIRRKAELRRRKLLLQSEDRMKRILGVKCGNSQAKKLCPEEPLEEPSAVDTGCDFLGSCTGSESQFGVEPPFPQLRLSPDNLSPAWTPEQSDGQPSPRPGVPSSEEHDARDLGQSIVRPGVLKPLRLLLSIVVAVIARLFFTSYTSLFVPFLNLEMVLFAVRILRSEPPSQSSLVEAAFALSGLGPHLVNRIGSVGRCLADITSDLCVYFFFFLLCHQLAAFES